MRMIVVGLLAWVQVLTVTVFVSLLELAQAAWQLVT